MLRELTATALRGPAVKVANSHLQKFVPGNVSVLGSAQQPNLEKGAREQVQMDAERSVGVSLLFRSGARAEKEQSRLIAEPDVGVKFRPDFRGAVLRACHGREQEGVAQSCRDCFGPTSKG